MSEKIQILSFEEDFTVFEKIQAEILRSLPPSETQHVSKKSDFINAILSNEWDVILVDYNQSEMYKVEALKLCKKLCFGTPVIYVTEALGESIAVDILKAGATDYILKENLHKLSFAILRAIKESKQKRAHAQIMNELRVKDHAIEQAGAGIIISKYVQGTLTIIYANKAANDITGFEKDELIGQISTTLDGPQTDKETLLEIKNCLENGKAFRGEVIQYTKDRKAFWANMTISPVFDEMGFKSQIVTLIEDITEQKELEQEMKAKNTLFSEVQSASKISIWEYHIENDQFSFSENTANLMGISSQKDWSHCKFINVFAPEYRDEIQSIISKSTMWRTKFDLDALIQMDNHKTKWVRFTGYPVFSESKVLLLRGMIYDIDDRKQQSLALEVKHKEALQYQSMLLSTQINPHFIFNSLNAVQYYILDQSIEPAINFISDFSTLMRGVLSNSMRTYISIKSETEWLKKYLDLEATRFSNKFSYELQIDQSIDIEDTQIPTMLLQPFVENAIIHGVGPMDKGGLINISFSKEGEKIICKVEDNGVGRDKANELGKLRKGNQMHQSYGMSITSTKIELLNELENGIFNFQVIDKMDKSGQSTGTIVEISYPISIS